MVTDSLFNKAVLICVLFLIGMTMVDCLKCMIPKTIEGQSNIGGTAMSVEATMHKHTGEIAILQEQLGTPLNALTLKVQELEKKTDSNAEQIIEMVKANGATATANAMELGIK
jgi:hypothetical protein